jgi:hypothetical protein
MVLGVVSSQFQITVNGGGQECLPFTESGGPANMAKVTGQPTLDDKGNIYGTTTEGGPGGYGVAFEMAP